MVIGAKCVILPVRRASAPFWTWWFPCMKYECKAMPILTAEVIHRVLQHALGKDIQRIDDVIGKHLTCRSVLL